MSSPPQTCTRCDGPLTLVMKMSGNYSTCDACDREFEDLQERIEELEKQLEDEKVKHQATYSIMMTAGRSARHVIDFYRFMARGWRRKMLDWKERYSILLTQKQNEVIDAHVRLVRAEEALIELSSRRGQNSEEFAEMKKERDENIQLANMLDAERLGLLKQVEELTAKLAQKEEQ